MEEANIILHHDKLEKISILKPFSLPISPSSSYIFRQEDIQYNLYKKNSARFPERIHNNSWRITKSPNSIKNLDGVNSLNIIFEKYEAFGSRNTDNLFMLKQAKEFYSLLRKIPSLRSLRIRLDPMSRIVRNELVLFANYAHYFNLEKLILDFEAGSSHFKKPFFTELTRKIKHQVGLKHLELNFMGINRIFGHGGPNVIPPTPIISNMWTAFQALEVLQIKFLESVDLKTESLNNFFTHLKQCNQLKKFCLHYRETTIFSDKTYELLGGLVGSLQLLELIDFDFFLSGDITEAGLLRFIKPFYLAKNLKEISIVLVTFRITLNEFFENALEILTHPSLNVRKLKFNLVNAKTQFGDHSIDFLKKLEGGTSNIQDFSFSIRSSDQAHTKFNTLLASIVKKRLQKVKNFKLNAYSIPINSDDTIILVSEALKSRSLESLSLNVAKNPYEDKIEEISDSGISQMVQNFSTQNNLLSLSLNVRNHINLGLSFSEFAIILKNNPLLQNFRLNLMNCSKITNEGFLQISKALKLLKLKDLTILMQVTENLLADDVFDEFCEALSTDLESLYITFKQVFKFTDKSFQNFTRKIQSLINIKELKIKLEGAIVSQAILEEYCGSFRKLPKLNHLELLFNTFEQFNPKCLAMLAESLKNMPSLTIFSLKVQSCPISKDEGKKAEEDFKLINSNKKTRLFIDIISIETKLQYSQTSRTRDSDIED